MFMLGRRAPVERRPRSSCGPDRAARRALVALATLATLAGSGPHLLASANFCDSISEVRGTRFTTLRLASGLSSPTYIVGQPNDPDRIFIVEQDGRIRLLKNGVLQSQPYLDLSAVVRSPADGGGGEQGLLGLAFHPNYVVNGRFFVFYSDVSNTMNVLVRYTRLGSNSDLADPNSGTIVLTVQHDLSPSHNGGMLAFGPDGYLYLSTGDGGAFCDPFDWAQDTGSLLGKILRIDVASLPYTIPAGNPFAGGGGRPEVWSWGLRNPWRFSFDRGIGDMYVGDVGQAEREEIDWRPAGATGGVNYGWDLYEGSLCPNPTCGSSTCSVPGLASPMMEYDHDDGCAVTSGYAYRGCRMPDLHGTYFYSDFCSAFLRSFRVDAGAATDPLDWTAAAAPADGTTIDWVTSFGEDARGEIYLVDRGTPFSATGEVFKIVPWLQDMEVSGPRAAPFGVGSTAWTWENLQSFSSWPIAAYRVYRTAGRGDGLFECVHEGPGTSWTGGDPASPPPGGLYTYLVTAVAPGGLESSPGTGSGGTPRILSSAACP